jgi:hypothetical protein
VVSDCIIKSISGNSNGSVSFDLLNSNSVSHSLEDISDKSLIGVLVGSNLINKLRIVAIVGTVLVSLSVSEFPDGLLDVPKGLFAKFINFCLPISSVSSNTGNSGILSGEKLSCESFNKSIEIVHGSLKLVVKGILKSLSSSSNVSFLICLEVIDFASKSFCLFWDTFHGVVNGMLDKSIKVVDVLDVQVLSVGENFVEFFNCNSLLESSISKARAIAP